MADTRQSRFFIRAANMILRGQLNWEELSIRAALLDNRVTLDFDRMRFFEEIPAASVISAVSLDGNVVASGALRLGSYRWTSITSEYPLGSMILYASESFNFGSDESGRLLLYGSTELSSSVKVTQLNDVILFWPAEIGGPLRL